MLKQMARENSGIGLDRRFPSRLLSHFRQSPRALLFLVVTAFLTSPVWAGSSHAGVALLVVDMQSRFLDNLYLEDKEDLLRKQKDLFDWASAHDLPVLVIQMGNSSPTIPEVLSRASEFRRWAVVQKNNHGGLDSQVDAESIQILRAWGVTKLIPTGVYASVCVRATVANAFGANFSILGADDLVADPMHLQSGFYSKKSWRKEFPQENFVENWTNQRFDQMFCEESLL
ncbi:MAG: cysteine hydrolase family protein [Bdellovibrionales bacterium]